jgi:hypothetical protein
VLWRAIIARTSLTIQNLSKSAGTEQLTARPATVTLQRTPRLMMLRSWSETAPTRFLTTKIVPMLVTRVKGEPLRINWNRVLVCAVKPIIATIIPPAVQVVPLQPSSCLLWWRFLLFVLLNLMYFWYFVYSVDSALICLYFLLSGFRRFENLNCLFSFIVSWE